MADFLLELLSEEIPSRMQAKACADLARLFAESAAAAGLVAARVETYSTPRRLALIARDLPEETAAVSEEIKGPRAGAAPQALEGFLRKTGLNQDQLVERDGILFALVEKPGQQTVAVLAEAIPAVLRIFPWPKSMRWGAASLSTEIPRWVRPLHGIVALLDNEIVDFEFAGIRSGAATMGHRFHHPGVITIGSANDYVEKLRACHVIIDPDERAAIIREGSARVAAAKARSLIPDEALITENAGLTEWPVPLLGGFDPAFLDVPREVIQLTMRTNQKYFAVNDSAGSLAPGFVCVANIEAVDGGTAIVSGNEKVLAARLSDAKFFWEQDLKIPLAQQVSKLDQIVFHQSLGTVADKVARVARLARRLAGGEGHAADQAERAANLCKADLVTGMVGEFPELQGVMGRYYALRQGEHEAVAEAIEAHYRPLGPEDVCPTGSVAVAVALADKIDTLAGFFGINERPTGSKDPYGLRRAALGVIRLITEAGLRFALTDVFAIAAQFYREQGFDVADQPGVLTAFFADRLKVQQREAGIRHDLIDAVFSLGGEDDLVRLLARVRALQSFIESAVGTDLLTGYRRAANILKKEDWAPAITPDVADYERLPEESALVAALDRASVQAAAAVEAEDFTGAMAALANLRAPVDAFFDKVTVNDVDPVKRGARLTLLARIRDAVHRVADFSRIEG